MVVDQRHRLSPSLPSTLLLFGGTFDPVHNGHVALLESAMDVIRPDAALVIPAGSPWQKSGRPLARAADRVAMLALALPGATIDQRELTREGPTYTVDTLRSLRVGHPHASLFWLIGSDSFSGLDDWHDCAALVDLVTFVVVRRAGAVLVQPRGTFRYREVVCTPPPISSTNIRERLSRHESIRGLVPDAVCDYIQQQRLYNTKLNP